MGVKRFLSKGCFSCSALVYSVVYIELDPTVERCSSHRSDKASEADCVVFVEDDRGNKACNKDGKLASKRDPNHPV